MKGRIWKYSLSVGMNTVRMNEGTTVLHVDNQREDVALWAVSNPFNPPVSRKFYVTGTDGVVDENMNYIGTVLLANASLVWHVFEVVGG